MSGTKKCDMSDSVALIVMLKTQNLSIMSPTMLRERNAKISGGLFEVKYTGNHSRPFISRKFSVVYQKWLIPVSSILSYIDS